MYRNTLPEVTYCSSPIRQVAPQHKQLFQELIKQFNGGPSSIIHLRHESWLSKIEY